MSKKFIIKKYIKYLFAVWRGTNHSPKAIYQFFKYNTFNEIIHGNVLIPASHVVIQLEKGGKIIKKGISYIGTKRYRKSKLETRLLIEKGGVLELGPNTNIMYGADIEVFHDARLIYKVAAPVGKFTCWRSIRRNLQPMTSSLPMSFRCSDTITLLFTHLSFYHSLLLCVKIKDIGKCNILKIKSIISPLPSFP